MKFFELGGKLRVSMCCLGTMTWGEQNTEEEAHQQLDYAMSKGVNFIDTAELYSIPVAAKTAGRTEEYIGRWLAKGGPTLRSRIVLASKVSGYSARTWLTANRTDPPGRAESTRLTREQILAACDGSLRRLQTTYLDLYQIHWPDRYTPLFGGLGYSRSQERADFVPFDEQVLAMGELIAAGKVRHWGISNENAFGVTKFCEAAARLGVPLPVSIQNDFCLLDRRFEQDGTAEACSPLHSGQTNGVALLAYGPLAGGTLSGKYRVGGDDGQQLSRHRKFPEFQPRYHSDTSIQAAARFAEVAGKYGMTPAQLALRWAASREYTGAVIIGGTRMAHLEENLAAFEADPTLPDECIADVDKAYMEFERPYFRGAARFGRAPDPAPAT